MTSVGSGWSECEKYRITLFYSSANSYKSERHNKIPFPPKKHKLVKNSVMKEPRREQVVWAVVMLAVDQAVEDDEVRDEKEDPWNVEDAICRG